MTHNTDHHSVATDCGQSDEISDLAAWLGPQNRAVVRDLAGYYLKRLTDCNQLG